MKTLASRDEEISLLEQQIREHAHPGQVLQILEAGAGREWPLNMDGVAYELTGIDMDAKALEARRDIQKDLHHVIVGDLRTATLPDGSYDVIYSSYVLEHIENAGLVLENFARWLRPGGLIIIRVPDRDSVHGFMTRVTPFQAHVLYKRHVMGRKFAGTPGHGPYETIYDRSVSRAGIAEFCASHGLTLRDEWGHGTYVRGQGLWKKIIPVFARSVDMLSFGRLHADFLNLTYIIEKPT